MYRVSKLEKRTGRTSTFLIGCSNFKSTALQGHESSTLHKDAVMNLPLTK